MGLLKYRCNSLRSLTPAGHKDLLLPRRLVTGRKVSGSPGFSSADHSRVVSEVGFHHQLEEVDAHPTENAYVSRSLLGYSQVDCSSGRAQGGGPSSARVRAVSVLGSSSSPVAEVPRSSGQLRRSGPELQASHETSTATPSLVLYPSVGLSVEADSYDTGDQEFVCSMIVSGSSAGRDPLLSSPSRPDADFRRLLLRLGSSPSASSGVGCLVGRGIFGPYLFSGVESGFSGSQEFGGPCKRLVSHDSFGQHNSCFLYQLSRRNSLAFSVLSGDRALGVVSSVGHSSPSHSHSGGGQSGSRLLVEGEVSPIRMDFESLYISKDLSGSQSSTGDRPFRVHSQLSSSEVLSPFQGSSGLKDGSTFLPVVRPSSVHFPTVLFSSQSPGEARDGADVALVVPYWPQRPWFPKLLSLLADFPRILPLQMDLLSLYYLRAF